MGSCSSMKVHQYARGFNWDHHDQLPSLTLSCKRLRPLAPKLHNIIDTATTPTTSTSSIVSSFDLKSFIRPESGLRKPGSSNEIKILQDSPQSQVETLPGGTRWNPTQEQIGILEMLYRGGMRTPNAQQIEQITAQLGKYGKIEGKNVFYWFQNHKARERQKQKRNSLGLKHSPRTPVVSSTTSAASITTTVNAFLPLGGEDQVEIREEDSPYYKRKCRSWAFECLVGDNGTVHSNACTKEDGDRTLQLFPLHPEGR